MDFRLGRNCLEQALAQDVVKLVAVRVDRGYRHCNAPRFGSDAMRCAVECGFERGLPTTVVRSGKIGDNQANIVHFRHGDKQIRQRGGGHDAQITIAHGHGDGVGQVRRQFVEEQHQRIATEQLLPCLGARCFKQGRDV